MFASFVLQSLQSFFFLPPIKRADVAFLSAAELHEQDGHPGAGEDGDQKVQSQGEGAAREQLRRVRFAEQQLHLRLRHLSGKVHRRRGKKKTAASAPAQRVGRLPNLDRCASNMLGVN